MRHASIRTTTISGAAISLAVLWGTLEFFALLWSSVGERFRYSARR